MCRHQLYLSHTQMIQKQYIDGSRIICLMLVVLLDLMLRYVLRTIEEIVFFSALLGPLFASRFVLSYTRYVIPE